VNKRVYKEDMVGKGRYALPVMTVSVQGQSTRVSFVLTCRVHGRQFTLSVNTGHVDEPSTRNARHRYYLLTTRERGP